MDRGASAPGFPASLESVVAAPAAPCAFPTGWVVPTPRRAGRRRAHDRAPGTATRIRELSRCGSCLRDRRAAVSSRILTAAEVRTLLIGTSRHAARNGERRIPRGARVVDACAAVARLVSTAFRARADHRCRHSADVITEGPAGPGRSAAGATVTPRRYGTSLAEGALVVGELAGAWSAWIPALWSPLNGVTLAGQPAAAASVGEIEPHPRDTCGRGQWRDSSSRPQSARYAPGAPPRCPGPR